MKVNYIYSFFLNYLKKASFYNTKKSEFWNWETKIRLHLFDFGKQTEVKFSFPDNLINSGLIQFPLFLVYLLIDFQKDIYFKLKLIS